MGKISQTFMDGCIYWWYHAGRHEDLIRSPASLEIQYYGKTFG